MSSVQTLHIQDNIRVSKTMRYMKFIIPILGIGLILGIVVLGLTIAVLVKVNKTFVHTQSIENTSVTSQQSSDSAMVSSIHFDEVMSHLKELQNIATAANGTRAISTPGFNKTIDYITNYLERYTNYNVSKTFFTVISTRLARNPIFLTSINGTITNHTYSADASIAEFYYIQYTKSMNSTTFLGLTVIPNDGCSDDDWLAASASPAGRVALVKRGNCTFVEKGILAMKYNVSGLLLYNDGTLPNRTSPIFVSLGENNTLPALFLSFDLGQKLANAVQQTPESATVIMNIVNAYASPFPSANICADTPSGDATQTIVIGSHTDSVPDGPGINDNGSGSAANLGLAVALARLFQTSTYAKYKYRVRFCWWGAEEVGLLGSDFHAKQAKNSSVVGERLADYLINLNYDMLGSPNYIFGIYDGKTANNNTPSQALPGSNKISALFRDWFIEQKLPWDFTDFSGRSDYGPFLAEGIVAGGLFSGADDMKTQEQRDRYDRILGQGRGGIAGIIQDPCYHQACDSIQNVNVFAYEKMVQAAAYVLEFLARQENLKAWLYPPSEIQQLSARSQEQPQREYNSVKEYFKLPYF